ncbi:MAG: TIGR00725 family protein [Candidatus Micrarchaeota archaeon]|nr:TIGR00725 family protein [Candidatus Micrarchaeota archaeon]
MRKFQIGVMGSVIDLNYSQAAEKAAERLGYSIARRGAILFFGAEKDYDSLSTAACRGARRGRGMTVGVTYGKHKNIWQKDADIIIPSGLERGGGRELVLTLACDAVIAISGGSGTLTELAIAYQADIPMVALKGFGGWADELAGKYFDGRKRRKVLLAKTPEEAVKIAMAEAKKYREKYENQK